MKLADRKIARLGNTPSTGTARTPEGGVSKDRANKRDTNELPSFFLVGPPRTGTTWLHNVLSAQTTLPWPTKETRFFDVYFDRGFRWYLAHFPKTAGERLKGEVAPTYFASDEARRRILAAIPNAKLIFIFRSPVQRVVSLYRIKRAYGMLPWTFEEAIENDPELIGSGMYSTHLAHWQEGFPERQLRITLYDDLRSDPQSFVEDLARFIGLPVFRLDDRQLRRMHSSEQLTQPRSYLATRTATVFAEWCKARGFDRFVASMRTTAVMKLFLGGGAPFPEISSMAVRKLSQIFLPEVEELEALLDRDLTHWKLAE